MTASSARVHATSASSLPEGIEREKFEIDLTGREASSSNSCESTFVSVANVQRARMHVTQ